MKKIESSAAAIPAKLIRWENFLRPPAPPSNSTNYNLIFQHLELDHYIFEDDCYGLSEPIIRMFGITKGGNSICCHIHGVSSYFHVNLPMSFTNVDLDPFRSALNDAVLSNQRSSNDVLEAVVDVKLVEGKSLLEYTGDEDDKFVKITLALPKLVAVAKRLVTTTIVYQPLADHRFVVLESNTDIETRFMVDSQMLSPCWIELPAEKWSWRLEFSDFKVLSTCQIEVDVCWEDLIVRAPDGEYAPVAKFRILSFDIECMALRNIIPLPYKDQIIQIANVVKCYGDKDVLFRNIFTLKSCAPIDHAEVYSFDTEVDMLEEWANFVRSVDPDIFTGYNINNFDFPYLIDRAKHLKLERFPYLGRLLDVASHVKKSVTTIKVGRRTYKFSNFEGRVPYDMFLVMRRNFVLESYSLSDVCKEKLGDEKGDMPYSLIIELQNGDEQTRKRLALYCIKDAEMALRLFLTMSCFERDFEESRRIGGSITRLLSS